MLHLGCSVILALILCGVAKLGMRLAQSGRKQLKERTGVDIQETISCHFLKKGSIAFRDFHGFPVA